MKSLRTFNVLRFVFLGLWIVLGGFAAYLFFSVYFADSAGEIIATALLAFTFGFVFAIAAIIILIIDIVFFVVYANKKKQLKFATPIVAIEKEDAPNNLEENNNEVTSTPNEVKKPVVVYKNENEPEEKNQLDTNENIAKPISETKNIETNNKKVTPTKKNIVLTNSDGVKSDYVVKSETKHGNSKVVIVQNANGQKKIIRIKKK